MENKNVGRFGEVKIKHKVCNNCGALMTWIIDDERYFCDLCGNADPSEEELKRKPGSYIG